MMRSEQPLKHLHYPPTGPHFPRFLLSLPVSLVLILIFNLDILV